MFGARKLRNERDGRLIADESPGTCCFGIIMLVENG